MTDRHIGYLVTLEASLREDDSQEIINAIVLLKGVACVEPIVDDINKQLATRQAIQDLTAKLWKVLYPGE